jgi:predicted Zn-dependent protease
MQVPELSFSRQHESRADAYALDIQNCVYGHVAGATDFFSHTAQLEQKRFIGHYLSTHPESSRRVMDMNKLALERGYTQSTDTIPFMFIAPVTKGSSREK